MSDSTMEYGYGTSLTRSGMWGVFTSAKVLCSDGIVRKVKRISMTEDTMFSVPCAVTVDGRTVTGFLSLETLSGLSTESDSDEKVVKFTANVHGANASLIPAGTCREDK